MLRVAIIVLSVLGSASLAVAEVDREALRKELSAQRDLNLKRFREYRKAGIYPHNTYEPGMKNVWRDTEDHLCAVANMIAKDGLEPLVDDTARKNNFVRLADVSTGKLIDWVLTSGFTHEEVVMIQWPSWAEDDPVGYARHQREMREQERARKREDKRLAAGYLATEKALKQARMREAGLDLAVARLAARPDLVAALQAKSKTKLAKK